MENRAWFVRRPGHISQLRTVHPLDGERSYRVVAEVTLGDMDFENFITDLYADRGFLEEYAHLCSAEGDTWSCILVRCPDYRDAVLVVPEEGRFVGWAAFIEMP